MARELVPVSVCALFVCVMSDELVMIMYYYFVREVLVAGNICRVLCTT